MMPFEPCSSNQAAMVTQKLAGARMKFQHQVINTDRSSKHLKAITFSGARWALVTRLPNPPTL